MASSDISATPPLPSLTIQPWRLEAAAVAAALETRAETGLPAEAAAERLERFGPNELVEKKQRPAWRLLLDQFTSAMIVVLLVAAVITALIGETKDTLIILAIVVFNGIVGFIQEYRAEQAMDALKRMSSPEARVVRDGEVRLVPAREVVPGDVLLLEQGDIVTADLRLLEAPAMRVNEAPLTGESEPVAKVTRALPDVSADAPADQLNMAFSGTAVTSGRARGIVVATGMATAIGRIAELLQQGEEEPTPLQKRLGELGRWLAVAALIVCALVFASGVVRGEDPEEMFLIAVSLAVAAIPEGLPAVVTISLALGARRMAGRRALVRRLPAVETLGSVSVICSDKTGTLTENRMLVERLWTPAGEYRVGGDGYAPEGRIEPDPAGDELAARAARVAAACNDATLVPPVDAGAGWSITGDPTEGALVAFAAKLGARQSDIRDSHPRVAEVGFDAERRRMTTLHTPAELTLAESGGDADPHWVAVKGALESIAPLLEADQATVLARGAPGRRALRRGRLPRAGPGRWCRGIHPGRARARRAGPATGGRGGPRRPAARSCRAGHRRMSVGGHQPRHDHRRPPPHSHVDRRAAGHARRRPRVADRRPARGDGRRHLRRAGRAGGRLRAHQPRAEAAHRGRLARPRRGRGHDR